MKLGLMPGEIVPHTELKDLGFYAMQMFFGGGSDGETDDPTRESIEDVLTRSQLNLAAMTLHVDLVGPTGMVSKDVDRLESCVEKTAQLEGLFGDNPQPILVWHPSGYPQGEEIDDVAVFNGLCEALNTVCVKAEKLGIVVAVEITRAGSVGSAESYLRIKDRIGISSLKVCVDAANFVPDRTPLDRSVRMLASDIVIAHGKDASFTENGEVKEYGPTGTGRLNYEKYIASLRAHTDVPYFVLEYYKNREDLIKARDVVLAEIAR